MIHEVIHYTVLAGCVATLIGLVLVIPVLNTIKIQQKLNKIIELSNKRRRK